MDEAKTEVGRFITVWRYQRKADSSWQVRIDITEGAIGIDEANDLALDLNNAIKIATGYEHDIKAMKYETVTIEYLVQKGWSVFDLNHDGVTVRGPNWQPVKPDGEKLKGYNGFTVEQAYKNIVKWAINNAEML